MSDNFVDEDRPAAMSQDGALPEDEPSPFIPRLNELSRFSSEFSEADDPFDSQRDERDNQEAYREEVHDEARFEIFGVNLMKTLFIVAILTTAGLVSAGTYIVLKAEEDDDYTTSYDLFVSSMRDAVKVHVESIFVGFDSMANMISSSAEDQGVSFPFYTMGNFEATGQGIRKFSNVEIFAWVPYIEATQVPQWMNYSNYHQDWLETSREYALLSGESSVVNTDYIAGSISPIIYDLNGPNGTPQPAQGGAPYGPTWQTSPPVFDPKTINFDFNSFSFANEGIDVLEQIRQGFFTRILVPGETGALASLIFKPEDHERFHDAFVDWNKTANTAFGNPHGAFMQPVFEQAQNTSSKIVGYLAAALGWDAYMTGLLPEGKKGLNCVVKNSCGQQITYELTGNRAYFVGWGDFHDTRYDSTERVIPFHRELPDDYDVPSGQCVFNLHIYSTREFEDSYRSNVVAILTAVVAGAFFMLIVSFFCYDMFVRRRNTKVVSLAAKSNEIVSSLFPKYVRDRLYGKEEQTNPNTAGILKTGQENENVEDVGLMEGGGLNDPTARSNDGLSTAQKLEIMDEEGFMFKSRPIADLYPECTILFADIAGFTAWSSTREPHQVFILLETIYKAFDTYAKRRRVFKVETIGDCYVAVAGLPEPMADHAVVMCRFARDCLNKMRELGRRLESVLGPDTMELDLRVGLHSGSVTAGVLRGEKSRFQLFGDTMNTASRMESTGKAGMVQISQSTADLVKAAGKGHWLTMREDKVVAKGKGEMQTYFVSSTRKGELNESSHGDESTHGSGVLSGTSSIGDSDNAISSKSKRLIKWNVEVFSKFLKQIADLRKPLDFAEIDHDSEQMTQYGPALDEVVEFVEFQPVESLADDGMQKPSVSFEAIEQLDSFMHAICSLYQEHPFHDFAHASHVTLSVVKFFSQMKTEGESSSAREVNPALLLSLDPIAQFACVFAALVQDISHPGVPNFVLALEGSLEDGNGRCIAEESSIERAWELLMDKNYSELRKAIYRTEQEKNHFREVFVQCLLATDLFDKDLQKQRVDRWEKAFGSINPSESAKVRLDRQATLVLESIIQASDMIHSMQHFDIYRKWNKLLFFEVHQAFSELRINKNPAEHWYEGELSFFDNVVFPMAEKLMSCHVFKDGTVEACIDFAKNNRTQWENQGQSIVAEMLVSCTAPE